MSQSFTKGQQCGIDNCPSRLWRSVEGRRVCQFGHVKENDYEVNDEEDEAYVRTRRLNLSGTSKKPLQSAVSEGQVYGTEGKLVFLNAYQCVLKSQVEWIVEHEKVPKVFEHFVQELWLRYLSRIIVGSDHDINSEEAISQIKSPPLIDTLVLCYLVCIKMKLTIFTDDFVMWCTLNKIPYMRSSLQLPPTLRRSLPNYYLHVFTPSRPPTKTDLHTHIIQVFRDLDLRGDVYYLCHPPLLLKTIREVALPLNVYVLAESYIKRQGVQFNLASGTDKKERWIPAVIFSPEVKLLGIVVTCVELYFLDRSTSSEFHAWRRVLQEVENKTLISDECGNYELAKWDDSQVESYLNWCQSHLVYEPQGQEDEAQMAQRRLGEIFKLEPTTTSPDYATDTDSLYNILLQKSGTDHAWVRQDFENATNLLIANLAKKFGLAIEDLRAAVRWAEKSLIRGPSNHA